MFKKLREFAGIQTIYGHGDHDDPYLTRIWIGRLRLHIFHRGDNDPDPHDHPWDFWTFPLTAYVEEVALPARDTYAAGEPVPPSRYYFTRQVVPAFRWSFRPAGHTHRVIGRRDRCGGHPKLRPGWVVFRPGDGTIFPGPAARAGKIITIVWLGKTSRRWGFLRNRDGNWCWTPWREYVFGGGKDAPCKPTSEGGHDG